MYENFYTPEEADFVKKTLKDLMETFKDEIPYDVFIRLRDIMNQGIEKGFAKRDKYGINPIVRHLNTAKLITEYFCPDKNMVIAVLLYQFCKSEYITADTVKSEFGEDIFNIVKGLLKVSILYKKQSALQNENFSKLMMAFAENIRVIIIMIIDRLGLMKMINHHNNQKFVFDVSSEVMYLYAPLAHRLGLYKIKSELEDMSLKYTNREKYTEIAHKLNETKATRDEYIARVIEPVEKKLKEAGLSFKIKGRTKSIFSIWNKMKKQNADLKDIFDLFAIRIIIDTPLENERRDCWHAFAIVTDMYSANPSRTKDWITIPKSNGYESLHTTVCGHDKKWVEIQIRTQRMDEIAEKGLAAHWKYKGVKSEQSLDNWMANVRDLLETSDSDTSELMKKMNMNIYDKEVFVFTPKGDLFKLPLGASVLDFAFAIHSKIGCACTGGKVNGRNQKINYKLLNGDTVEIITSSNQQPKLQWLNFVITSKARNKIRQTINEINNKSAEFAKELLKRRFKNRKVDLDESVLTKVIKKLGYKTATDFYNEIADEKIDVNTVIEAYIDFEAKIDEPTVPTLSAQEFVMQQRIPDDVDSDEVIIIGEGIKGINYKLSKCCTPIIGDKIIGFISTDGAIKIHKSTCPNALHLKQKYPYRIINAEWSGKIGKSQSAVPVSIVGVDNIGVVNSITSIISKESQASLRSISIESHDGFFEGNLVIGINDNASLNSLLKKISNVKGVKNVQRSN